MLNPVAAIILAITGIGMFTMSAAKKAEMLKALDDEAKAEGEVVIPDDSKAVTE